MAAAFYINIWPVEIWTPRSGSGVAHNIQDLGSDHALPADCKSTPAANSNQKDWCSSWYCENCRRRANLKKELSDDQDTAVV